MDVKDKTKGVEEVKKSKVRITLTCRNMKSIEKGIYFNLVCSEIVTRSKARTDVKVFGPVRMPIKNLKITVRKSPCGEGTNTYERLEMRIYKRIIDLVCTNQDVKEITSIKIDPGVEVELTMTQDE